MITPNSLRLDVIEMVTGKESKAGFHENICTFSDKHLCISIQVRMN